MRSHKYPYVKELPDRNLRDSMPFLPLVLEQNGNTVDVFGLLDSGSTVNVLPYNIGVKLGAIWENQTISSEFERKPSGF